LSDLYRSACELLDALTAHELSPVELMQDTLDRIDATREALGALVALRDRDDLLEDARRAEDRYTQGRARALEGLPLGVKDLQDAEGLPTTQGSLVFRDNVATEDSVEVGRLRAAGAIVVGKTNTPEWGYTAITKNLVHGVTHNPWNLELTPGGSSGGSAAAIAAGVLPLSTATDGGGSVRIPASFTGCFGLKPSFGRVPHPSDYWIMGDTSVPGPLTRSVEDAARQLDASVGAHPLDPNSLPHPGYSYRERLDDLPPRLRIGWAPDLGYAVVQSDVAAVSLEATRVFERLRHHFHEHEVPLPALGRDWGMMNAFESLGELAPHIEGNRDAFGRSFLRGVEAGRHMTPELWGELRRQRGVLNRWCADTFERFDLLLTPTVPCDPPPAKGPFPEEIEGRPLPAAGVAAFTIPFNLSWHPAASVRAGFSDAGLPVGLQIVGPRHRDDLVLQAARAFERERPWQGIWPDL
jgi:aspartyl-tRNA(Asn)/glutamyl-tRNA(Gln) amidotransferase subunit A